MNSRERLLAILLVFLIIGVGGGVFGYRLFWVPWNDKQKTLTKLKQEYQDKQLRLAQIEAERPKLALYRGLSLPAEDDVARREYEKFLNGLLSRNGFAAGYTIISRPVDRKTSPTLPGAKKEPIYTRLTFNVRGYASMGSLVHTMEEFYRTGLLHQIKSLSLQRQLTTTARERAEELDVNMTVEALIVTGADNRSWILPNVDRRLLAIDLASGLRHGVPGLGLALWATTPMGPIGPDHLPDDPPREYNVLASKNIFLGRPPVQNRDEGTPDWIVPRFAYLVDVTTNDRGRTEGRLYDRYTNRTTRLRSTFGFNTFPLIRDNTMRSVVLAAVARIEDRDIVYRVQMAAQDSGSPSGNPGFFPLEDKDRSALVAEKVISGEKDEQVYRVDKGYWDLLTRLYVITPTDRAGTSFRISIERDRERPPMDREQSSPVELTRGKVLKMVDSDLIIKVEERFYNLHIGANLEESLRRALPEKEVKDLKMAAAGG